MADLALAETEPGSFLKKPAHSTQALVNQVRRDPVVAGRFMRHFGMSRPELLSYLSGLRTARLTSDRVSVVYNVRPGERITSRVFELKKGAWVFADKYGRPVLKKACANPLTKGPIDLIETPTQAVIYTTPPSDLKDLPEEGEPLELYTIEEILEPAIAMVPDVTTPEVNVPPTITEGESPIPIGGGGPGMDWLPLLLLPFIEIGSGGGGGSFSPPPPPPPPIPAPAAAAVFGLMLARFRRR